MTSDWLAPEFDRWRAWIEEQRNKETSWEEIRLAGKSDEGELLRWMMAAEQLFNWPALGDTPERRLESWGSIVDQKRHWEEEAARLGQLPIVVGRDESDREVTVPVDPRSSWRLYRTHLENQNWKMAAVDSIEGSSIKILRRLKYNTDQPKHAVKGMVVGHVQSGKTASIAGLICMAADWQWNMVIVLTGSIESLRKQTESRLFSDINHAGNLAWHKLDHPSYNSPVGARAQDCNFGNTQQRYLIVSLKNSSRLRNLRNWLNASPNSLAQMHILIIDDEADQASIDTLPDEQKERTVINELIVELTQVRAACVNYVAYTATPYANFLNEAYPEGLYPQDFIIALPQSDEHFGPKQIFGIAERESEGGLGIVNVVPLGEVSEVRELHSGSREGLPQSLKDSVCWFLCAVAAIRAYGDIHKPVSMLVHTSASQAHHDRVADAIEQFLKNQNREEVLACCRNVWTAQLGKLTLDGFKALLPHYGRLADVRDYPSFDVLPAHLAALLEMVTPIRMEEEEAGAWNPVYHAGVHLCIDNCAKNGLNDENEHLRLLYPSKTALADLAVAPAFIVVGGSTLARGLTLENLVSTYFLRAGAQMDTLMQMGRWFGYRPGYELLPRIWMPDETRQKFVYMAGVEQELREDLARFMDCGADPKDYGPRVKVHPQASWLRPTAKNRMKAVTGDSYDFSGINKQTTIFHAAEQDKPLLQQNIKGAEGFLRSLGAPEASPKGPLVWRGVPFDDIAEFLCGQVYHRRVRFFTELEPFFDWYRANRDSYKDWNVVAAGKAVDESRAAAGTWWINGGRVGKIQRTRLKKASDASSVSIGTLRDPRHLLADAGADSAELPENAPNSAVARAREEAGLGQTPQLLLYRIDKSSKVERDLGDRSALRDKLGVPEDLIGVSIWLPGAFAADRRTQYATHVTVRIPPELQREDDDATELRDSP